MGKDLWYVVSVLIKGKGNGTVSFAGFARAALGAVGRRLPLRIRNDLEGLLALDWPDRPPIGVGSFGAETVLIVTTCGGGGIGACAGSMALHARADAFISVAIAGLSRSGDAHISVITRQALRAAFMAIGRDCQIADLDADSSSAQRNLTDILERLHPTVIYHPSLFTVDEGEKNLNLMLHRALRSVSRSSVGSWSPAIRGMRLGLPSLQIATLT